MLIASIQPVTLVDYPDKIATLVFTPGCNLRCRFCHNPELVLPMRSKSWSLVNEDDFWAFLHRRKGLIEGVVITGGEPTLQRDLPDFCQKIKQMGYSVKLDTNGGNSIVLEQLILDGLVDYVAMDLKIDNDHRHSLTQSDELLASYEKSIAILLSGKVQYEFRTTLFHPYHTQEVFLRMLESIHGAKTYYLQSYRPDITLDPSFQGYAFRTEEMEQYQHIASKFVEACYIR